MRLVIVLVVALGCGKRADTATSKCAEAAQQGVDAMVARAKDRLAKAPLPPDVRTKMEERTHKLEELAPRLRAVLTNRCVDDKWPAEVISCHAKASTMDEVRKCRAQLSPEQLARVQREELDLMAGAMGPPGFGSAALAPRTPEVAQLEDELRQLNTQLADAVKKTSQATTDADRDAARAAAQQLQTQMQVVNAKLADARARATSSAATDVAALVTQLQSLDKQIDAATAAVVDAKTDADRNVAKAALQALQKEHAALKAKIDAGRAAPAAPPGPTPPGPLAPGPASPGPLAPR